MLCLIGKGGGEILNIYMLNLHICIFSFNHQNNPIGKCHLYICLIDKEMTAQRSEAQQGHTAAKVTGLGLKLRPESVLLEFTPHCLHQCSFTHLVRH